MTDDAIQIGNMAFVDGYEPSEGLWKITRYCEEDNLTFLKNREGIEISIQPTLLTIIPFEEIIQIILHDFKTNGLIRQAIGNMILSIKKKGSKHAQRK